MVKVGRKEFDKLASMKGDRLFLRGIFPTIPGNEREQKKALKESLFYEFPKERVLCYQIEKQELKWEKGERTWVRVAGNKKGKGTFKLCLWAILIVNDELENRVINGV